MNDYEYKVSSINIDPSTYPSDWESDTPFDETSVKSAGLIYACQHYQFEYWNMFEYEFYKACGSPHHGGNVDSDYHKDMVNRYGIPSWKDDDKSNEVSDFFYMLFSNEGSYAISVRNQLLNELDSIGKFDTIHIDQFRNNVAEFGI